MEPLLVVVEPGLTVTPVEPELEPEQEPGDLSSSGPGPRQMESGEVGERNSSGIWRCFCIRRLAEEEEDLHTGVDTLDTLDTRAGVASYQDHLRLRQKEKGEVERDTLVWGGLSPAPAMGSMLHTAR